MKKLLAMIGVAMGLSFLTTEALAANPATLVLRVTPGVTRDVTVSTGVVAYGSLALGSTNNIFGTSVTVTNSGNVTSTFALRTSNSANWTAGAAAGADVFNLRAIFNGATAAVAANFGAEDDLTTTSTASSATVYSNGVQTGVGVPASGARGLWFKLNMPTSSSVSTQQDIGVEVLAQ
jgi:hypothetical protein